MSFIQHGPHHGRTLFTRSTTLAPPRFLYSYQNFGTGNATLDSQIQNVVVPAMNNFFTHALKVYQISSPLIMPISTCGSVTVPSAHLTTGVNNVDIIVYITSDTSTGKSYIAQGGPCAIDQNNLGNIIAGTITINNQNFVNHSFDTLLCTFVHEMTHLLGFVGPLFSL